MKKKKTGVIIIMAIITTLMVALSFLGTGSEQVAAEETNHSDTLDKVGGLEKQVIEAGEEVDPLQPQKQRMAKASAANRIVAYHEQRKAELLAEGWSVATHFEEGTLPLKNGNKLNYYFGPFTNLGQQVWNGRVDHRMIPNASILTSDNQRVHHLFAKDDLRTSPGLVWAESYDIVAPNRKWLTNGYFKRVDAETGLSEYKLIYSPDGNMPENDPAKLKNTNFTVEVTMTPDLKNSAVKVSQYVTNQSGKTFNSFMFGQDFDTSLNDHDKVDVKLAGLQRGVYIESNGYRLDYDFRTPNPPDNWVGRFYWGWFMERGVYYKPPLEFLNKARSGFEGPSGTGDELDTRPAGTKLTNGEDSGIRMKNQPIVFAAGEQTGFEYLLKINRLTKVVIEMAHEHDVVNLDEDYLVKGTWHDIGADELDLYYQVGDEEPIQFASKVPNPVAGEKHPFEIAIPKEKLGIGNHTITIIGTNDDDIEGSAAMNLDINSSIKINYVDINDEKIREPDYQYGLRGSEYRWEILDLEPDYEFIKVENSEVEGNFVIGKFSDRATEITYVYKEIPKFVTMTVKFIREDGSPIEDVENNTTINDQVVEDMLIGSTFNPADYKKVITGFDYYQIEDPVNGTVPDTDFSISIIYKGVLGLVEVPNNIDFGTQNLIASGNKVIRPQEPMKVSILDTRKSTKDWKLTLALENGLKNSEQTPFRGEVWFKGKDMADTQISDTSKAIHLRKTNVVGHDSVTWDNAAEGVYLKQFSGNTKDSYTGKFIWTITDAL